MRRTPRVLGAYITTEATISYSHALAALAGELRLAGWDTSELRLLRLDGPAEFYLRAVLQESPDVVLLSVMSNQWDRAVDLAHQLRHAAPGLRLGVGGSHVIADPGSVLSTGAFDFAVTGEADKIIAETVLDVAGRSARPLITTMIDGRTVETLDDLARPAVDLFSIEDVRAYPSVMFSRGCPYRCTYCMSRKGGIGGTVRWKSPQRALAEVLDLVAYAEPSHLNIDDDTLLKNPKWIRRFAALYEHEVGLPFNCNARPETITPHLAETLAQAGCSAIGIGIESGSQRIRSEVLSRPMTDERIIAAFRTAREAGLRTWSFNMVGLPTETAADLELTIALNEACQPDDIRVSIYTPYPGTPLGDALSYGSPNLSYLRSASGLPEGLREVATAWLRDLVANGRLWYTETELAVLIADLGCVDLVTESGG